jgi:maltose/maltodextrin transport system substrate-binding protein/arabinogalactan oligomer/maltooligosaccharide transport system substrate-binding protein
MPYAVENVAFFRNTDLVPEAPATWDDVRSITEELVSSGESDYGYMIQSNDPYHFQPLMSAFGGYVFARNEDGSYNPADLGIDNEGTIAAGDWLAGMVADGYIVPDVDYDVMHAMFENGDAAMIVSGPWALPRIRESGVPFAISDIPAGPAGAGIPFVGGQGFYISAFTEHPLEAEAFLTEFIATSESMLALYNVDPRPPAYLPVLESIDDDAIKAFQAAGSVGIPLPAIPEMGSVWGSWGNAEQFIILGQLEPQQAFADAAGQIRELIGSLDAMASRVSIAGSFQAQLGCSADWMPECDNTVLTDNGDGTYSLTTDALAAGDYAVKVTHGGTWDENYGADGARDGADVPFTVAADNTPTTFTYDSSTHILTITSGG